MNVSADLTGEKKIIKIKHPLQLLTCPLTVLQKFLTRVLSRPENYVIFSWIFRLHLDGAIDPRVVRMTLMTLKGKKARRTFCDAFCKAHDLSHLLESLCNSARS